MTKKKTYHRYQIETKKASNLEPHPCRFKVKVSRLKLAHLLIHELWRYRGQKEVILSRPCVYGVFSGPVGGFAPRESLCVGCLRCTTEYPDMVKVLPNPERQYLGDGYFTPDLIDTVIYEAETGRIPIKGAGYRGKFGGPLWDGMWTDMSEIVRPTRDGIHGREYISTVVDIGGKPPFLTFDEKKQPTGLTPHAIKVPIPVLFDPLPIPLDHDLCTVLNEAVKKLQTFAIVPFKTLLKFHLKLSHFIPLLHPKELEAFKKFGFEPLLLEMQDWNESFYKELKEHFPRTILILRTPFDASFNPIECYKAGVRVFHFTANYRGRSVDGRFIEDLIQETNQAFVKAGCREEVTLIGSGGMVAAEHLAKSILLGLDAVAMDTPLIVALQGRFTSPCISREECRFQMPKKIPIGWGQQRLINLVGSWRDQLLEILSAMGIREVRRLRGEMGRVMFQKQLEKEAFAEIEGYEG